MHKEILTPKQLEILPLLKVFSNDFGLVGGTAIALHLGHRKSIDFDLFTHETFDNEKIRDTIRKNFEIQSTLIENPNELTVVVNGVKVTFFTYPFEIIYPNALDRFIKYPDILTLAAMKSFALARRAMWKNYVDLYFIFKTYTVKEISQETTNIFGKEFNERLFREQLAYFNDIDYSETIDYMEGFSIPNEDIKQKLADISVQD